MHGLFEQCLGLGRKWRWFRFEVINSYAEFVGIAPGSTDVERRVGIDLGITIVLARCRMHLIGIATHDVLRRKRSTISLGDTFDEHFLRAVTTQGTPHGNL